MRRVRQRVFAPPSLFPFLSVLVCLIGTLIFLAVAVAPTSLEKAAAGIELEIIQGAHTHNKEPIILECSAGQARSLDGVYSFAESAEGAGSSFLSSLYSGPFTRFVENLSRYDQQKYVLFLVKPDGLSVFETLRGKLMQRNREKCVSSVFVIEELAAESVKQMQKELPGRVEYSDRTLSFYRRMSADERETLRKYFSTSYAHSAIDRLFEQSQSTPLWVDYGVELIPKNYEIKSVRQREAPEAKKGETNK